MKLVKILLLFTFILSQFIVIQSISADPIISNSSGTVAHGESVVITGSDFGTKSTATPLIWDDFETGTVDDAYLKDNTNDQYDWRKYGVSSYGDGCDYADERSYSGNFSAAHQDDEYTIRTCWHTFPDMDEMYVSYYYRADVSGTIDTPMIKLARINSNQSIPAHYGRPGSLHIQWQPHADYTYSQYNPDGDVGNKVQQGLNPDIQIGIWQRVEMYYRLSTPGVANGEAWITINGVVAQHSTNILTRASGEDFQLNSFTLPTMIEVQSADWDLYCDDVYVDNTRARVELGNNPDFYSCTKREVQKATVWNSSSITVDLNQGTFANGQDAYLFVVDANGVPSNANHVVIGQSDGADIIPPTVNNQSPTPSHTGVARDTSIVFHVVDGNSGVDQSSITLLVNNSPVMPVITGSANDYTVTYNPPSAFGYGQTIDIKINARDHADPANVMAQVNYTFDTEDEPMGTSFSSGPLGDTNNYSLKNGSRWELAQESSNFVYTINTTSYSSDGDKAGEHAIYTGQTYTGFDFQLRGRSDDDLASNTFADFVMIFGYTNSENYYYVMYNQDNYANRLFRVTSGVRTELETYSGTTINDNNLHTARVQYVNSNLVISYNGTVIMNVSGISIPEGNIGFGSYNDSASFDDVTASEVSSYAVEDVNRDTNIDTIDVNYVRDETIGINTQYTSESDVDGSGDTDVVDVQKVVNAL